MTCRTCTPRRCFPRRALGAIRILGIDPGLGITGYGVVEKEGAALCYVASGRIVSDERQSLAARLATILAGLEEVIGQFAPVEVAVEKVFVNVNPNSTLLLGQARRERVARVRDDAPARHVREPAAGLLDHAVSGDAEAGVDAEDADRAQPNDAVV